MPRTVAESLAAIAGEESLELEGVRFMIDYIC